MIFGKLPFAIDVLHICCNLQHTVVWIKEVAFHINRACKNVLVTKVSRYIILKHVAAATHVIALQQVAECYCFLQRKLELLQQQQMFEGIE